MGLESSHLDKFLYFILSGALGMLVYTYAGYPLMLWLWAKWSSKAVRKGAMEYIPSVTIVIAAWNEAATIRARVENCLNQEYPRSKLDVVVVSDGSTDRTDAQTAGLDSDRVTLISLKVQSGKAVALNHGVAAARGEIVVFTDARQHFSPTAIRELVGNFADSSVGAVTGELILEEAERGSGRPHAVGTYWRIEKWIRQNEGSIDSVVGATGANYAIRKNLYQPLVPGTILDDMLTPMSIVMKGYRVVFEPRAHAYDAVTADHRVEFSRKVRTLAGNYQAISLCPELLNPVKNRLFLQFLSHKVCRLFAPFCMVALLVANLKVHHGWLGILLAVQITGYAMALAGWGLRAAGIRDCLTSTAFTFCLLNYAALFGAVQFFSSRRIAWGKPVS